MKKQNCGSQVKFLPRDCALLPLTSGMLLVSPAYAVFCHIHPNEVDDVRALVQGFADATKVNPELLRRLQLHGFFDSPRPAKLDPPTVQIQLTNACNLACAYCCTNSGLLRSKEVGYEEVLEVVRQIPELFGEETSVALLGGEPFLVPWAFILADEIVNLGLKLTVFTNGTPLANDHLVEKAAWLIKRGVRVRVSLSGPSSESCDSIAGASRFRAALAAIQKLAALGCQVTVDLMFMPQGVETVVRELPQLRQQLPPGTPITFGILYLSGREHGEHLFASRSELEEALDRVAFEAGEVIPASNTSPTTYRREACSCALGNHLHIRSDGALFNCFKMEEQVGHLHADGFLAAARWSRAHPHLARYSPTCSACPLVNLCGAGCRSENMLYTGDPDHPPCGPWRVRVLSELLAEDRVGAVEWPVAFLLQEAHRRGIEAPTDLLPCTPSRHLIEI